MTLPNNPQPVCRAAMLVCVSLRSHSVVIDGVSFGFRLALAAVLLVATQVNASHEARAANIAHVRADAGVDAQVLVDVTAMGEFLATRRTLIRLFTRVETHMVVVIVGAGKRLTACGADVRLVARVLAVVAVVVHHGDKHLAARPAHDLVGRHDDRFGCHNEAGDGICVTHVEGDTGSRKRRWSQVDSGFEMQGAVSFGAR